MLPIYMDHHATTPVDPRVFEAMRPTLEGPLFGNAASRSHVYGHRAREAVEAARAEVAALLGARAGEIVFTSGATESDNLALKGVLHHRREAEGRDHLIVARTEHKAVLDAATRLETFGFRVTRLPVDGEGRMDPEALAEHLDEKTALVSAMLANNEVGALNDLERIGALCRDVGAWLHCDAAQGLGYVPLDVTRTPVDLVSLTAHKLYGPKGVGALWVRRKDGPRVRLVAEMDGGGHEKGMRSGTLNVPGIVGFGAAAAIQKEEGPAEAERLAALRARLWEGLAAIEEVHLNGPPLDAPRHPGNLNVSFGFVEGEGLLLRLAKTVAVSSGSACSSAGVEPSFVLRAMGVDPDLASASIRYGLGRGNTEADVDAALEATREAVGALREGSALWRAHLRGETVR
ncbi:MAG TPA: aminotransferase class V-fold PLP-dependent enzyme, partial [Polyangiaceae bacterium LLY-WYZ-15_(1-7)]|nr:aminotransferase class V-fold PLP-dependent enzyme [Polyangiaceae bacterium LLY-WYZ-15_(1-7)]